MPAARRLPPLAAVIKSWPAVWSVSDSLLWNLIAFRCRRVPHHARTLSLLVGTIQSHTCMQLSLSLDAAQLALVAGKHKSLTNRAALEVPSALSRDVMQSLAHHALITMRCTAWPRAQVSRSFFSQTQRRMVQCVWTAVQVRLCVTVRCMAICI
jgi:hypothetical protein